MKRVIPLLFLLCYIISSNAQEPIFSKSTPFESLSSVETYQVFQDSKGFIWVTSDAGLFMYNGSVLKKFTVKDGISENVVLKACEDSRSRIWFSTLSGYFFYYENDQFHQIAANEELEKTLVGHVISFFVGDNDTLFFSNLNVTGLIKIPPKNNYKKVIHEKTGYETCDVFCYIDKKTKNKAIFGIGRYTYYLNIFNCNGKIRSITDNLRNRRKVSTQIERGGIDRDANMYFLQENQIIVYRKQTCKLEYYTLPYPPLTIFQDKDADLWVGTTKGGYLFKNSDLTKKPLAFLPSLTICSFIHDRENSIWVATTQKGILKSNNKKLSMFSEKAVYFQKDSNQLNIISKQKRIISVFKNDSFQINNDFSKYLSREDEFRCAYIDPNYSYSSTYSAMTFYKNRRDNVVHKRYYHIAGKEIFKINRDTFCIIGSHRHLSFICKGVFFDEIRLPFIANSYVRLKDKTILLGSRDNSGIYELKNRSLVPYMSHIPQLKTRVNCMVEDTSGNLWFATNEQGLYCLDKHKKLHTYNSLVSDKLNSIVFDDQSHLWAASNNELIKFDFSTGFDRPIISTYDQSNGLPDLRIEKIIAFNGYIWCATNEQMFRFKGADLTSNKTPPLVYISNVLVNGNPIQITNTFLKLKHNENNIRILSTVITNKSVEKRAFLYKLKGYDDNWYFSSLGDFQYTNLNPGNYDFVIYGLNNDRLKSNFPVHFTFVIDKPFWYTWWFILLEICAAFTAIYLYFKSWKRKIEKREHEKTLVNQKIAEFKMTALRSQMNPHFIFNAIGSIQHYILKNEVKQSYNYLSTFSMLIRNILNNSGKEYISIDEEISVLKLYIELEQIRFTNPFKFIVEIDEQLDMETDIPTMLIQPYIENSIWHGLMPKEREGILTLIFKKMEDSVYVIIRDNGVGRSIKQGSGKNISKGMSITAQRIQTLEAANQRKFIVNIIDLKDENSNPAGTEVHLIIPIDL